jgi:hypothetical protein
MKTVFKSLYYFTLFLLVCLHTSAQNAVKEKEYEKTKNVSQSYSLSNSDKVYINNQFGNVKVNTWADTKIKVDVEIVVSAKTEARATKIIDGIVIKHDKTDGLVTFKTKIDETTNTMYDENSNTTTKTVNTKNGKTVNKSGDDENCNCNYGKNSQSMKINYTVFMPATTTMKLYNSFGNILLSNYEGALDIKNEYGNLVAGNLSNASNEISIEYGNAEIKSLNNPDFKIGYGNCDIETISGKGEMHFDYSGDVSIGLGKDIGDLRISNDYSTLEVTVNENANASVVVNSSYGEVKNKNKNLILKTEQEDESSCCNFTKKHEGKIGAGIAKIKIDNEYGKIKFR